MALIPGIKVEVGGREFTVPCFSFAAARRLDESKQTGLAFGQVDGTAEERYHAVLEVARTAIVRNHPEVTKDQLEELLDQDSVKVLLRAILQANHMDKADPDAGEQGPRPVAQGGGASLHGPEVVPEPT